jgi:hypothetical protein
MKRIFALSALVLLSLAACDKKETAPTAPSESPPPAAVPAPAAAAPAAAEPVVDVATLPVEEQYEADAEKEITADNLSAKLDELEKEISAP